MDHKNLRQIGAGGHVSESRTREPQYDEFVDMSESGRIASLGPMAGGTWNLDPKRLVFTLSRYKFVAKMLEGQSRVVEVGCADGFASRIVRQSVRSLTGVDFDETFIDCAKSQANADWPIEYMVHDLVSEPLPSRYSAAYLLDVLEHIRPQDEERFLLHLAESLDVDGVAIIGMPSLESQPYASPASREGHVNCQSAPQFRATMEKHFRVVFMFSMNDEVVHTGFHKMANYLFAIGVIPHRVDCADLFD